MPPRADVVLLVTHSRDHYTIDRVAEELSARGARPVRVDTDRFPAALALSVAVDASSARHVLCTPDGDITERDVRAVWIRKLAAPRLDDDLDPAYRAACVRESTAVLRGFLSALSDRRVIDPVSAATAAEDKLRQLRLARGLGLDTPRTLVTNAPDRARAFVRAVHADGGQVVAKMLTSLSVSMDGASPQVYTSAVTEADLDAADDLRLCPMVFQERVAKARELRVIVAGDRVLAGAIEAGASARGQVDWRRARPGECAWAPADVPEPVADRLRRLVAAQGLRYGAADVIVTPDGRHVFLEVNPSGEWGMLERDAGVPVAAALADALLAPPGS